MKISVFDLIKFPAKFFWRKINNWLGEKEKLKKKLKESEEKLKKEEEKSEKYKNLLKNEKKSNKQLEEQLAIKNQNFNNLKEENAKLKLKLENREKFKDYLQEKKLFIEDYYRKCILKLKGYICSYSKEKEIIFSLLNLFIEEYLHAFCLKEKIFQDDFIFFQEFFSLRLSNAVDSTTTDENLITRDYLIRASLYATIRKYCEIIGKIGINKPNLLEFIIDEYIQKHAMQLLHDYFVYDSYSSFIEDSIARLSLLKSLVIPLPQNIPMRNSAI